MVQCCWTIGEIKENNDLGLIAGKRFRSDEGLARETLAFLIFLQWPIYLIISVDKIKYLGFLDIDSYRLSSSPSDINKSEINLMHFFM